MSVPIIPPGSASRHQLEGLSADTALKYAPTVLAHQVEDFSNPRRNDVGVAHAVIVFGGE